MIIRHTQSLPVKMMEEIKVLANEHERTVTDIVRITLRAGLMLMDINSDPNKKLIVESNGQSREVKFIV